MIAFDPNALYSSAEVHDLVGETLFRRIKHVALCRDRYLGKHVLEALDRLGQECHSNAHVAAADIAAIPARKGGAKRGNATRRNRFSEAEVGITEKTTA